MSICDDERPGRPIEITNREIIEKIHDAVTDETTVRVREIAGSAGTSNDCLHDIMYEHSYISLLFGRWKPGLLITNQRSAAREV
ncbi:hypothetical protein AVEN_177303-1 [Araneus ventricosus]|uniref:Uncharacterized protein n=1 Tax=Araneus ventricosus TaxID=182803 RepID=A0A4Y2C7G8_ARAVE|nr:hypothetical protein AVEN_177303-1 [Araneus ventricosus]